MKIRRAGAAIAAVATGALLFSACSSPTGSESEGEATDGATATETAAAEGPCKGDIGDVTTADENVSYSSGEVEFAGYNSNTPETYSTYNNTITERMFSKFVYFGTDGTICQDESYGTYEKVSDDPLTVEYTLADDAVWSDGTPVTYADYLLEWAAQALLEDGTVVGELKPDDVPLFNHISGLTLGDYVPEGPQADAPDAKTFTYEYERPYADWEIQVDDAFPAHIVAEQIGISTEELVTAIQELDVPTLKKAAKFWNEGWLSPTPGELPDSAIVPVSGPYMLKENGWVAGQSITLTANENYWGTPPGVKELTYRFAAADTHVQALQNGDLNVIEPQATVDTVQQLEAIGDSITIATGQTLTWEHLDFNFKTGPFADSLPLREAFAHCVPRQKIVDDLIKPIEPSSVVMNAREVFPFQDSYEEVVSGAYDGRFDQVDLDQAKQKIAEAGVETPIRVRIGYSAPNPRRADQVAAIKSSCDQAGFEVVDAGAQDFFLPGGALETGDYEVAMFAWAGSGQIASGQNIYASTGTQNYGGFANDEVDAAWDTLASSVDPAVHAEQVQVIEKLLWDNLFGIPLFAHPGVAAFSSDLQNVRDTAAQDGIVWNAEQWIRAAS